MIYQVQIYSMKVPSWCRVKLRMHMYQELRISFWASKFFYRHNLIFPSIFQDLAKKDDGNPEKSDDETEKKAGNEEEEEEIEEEEHEEDIEEVGSQMITWNLYCQIC